MNKKNDVIIAAVFLVVFGVMIGLLLGASLSKTDYENIWRRGGDGIFILNDEMKDDKTDRLWMFVVTRKKTYAIESIYSDVNVMMWIKPKPWAEKKEALDEKIPASRKSVVSKDRLEVSER